MFYDLRISIGMLFTLIGTVLTAFGLATRSNADVYARSMGIDANLWWGLVLLVFGIAALVLGRREQMKQEKNKK
jgi:multisubunit Na+/H+ antiporter MnhG subunit